MSSLTVAQVITGVRELSFDRFSTPVFFLSKPGNNYSVTITSSALIVKNDANVVVETYSFSTYPTLKELSDALMGSSQNYTVSFNAHFTDSAECSMLLQYANKPLNQEVPVYKRYYFTDNEILSFIEDYFAMILQYPCGSLEGIDYNTELSQLNCPRPRHLMLWCAYQAVDKRRLSEMAATFLSNTATEEGGQYAFQNTGSSMSVQIGDVFSLQESSESQYNEGEQPWRVGADNVLGDANTFYAKLALWLRKKLEDMFGDYSLRSSNIMQSEMTLVKERNFYAYFDSYPYTISPYTRDLSPGIDALPRNS